jgi:CheY-like chemotaxis protein
MNTMNTINPFYRIIWVDDRPDWVESVKEEIIDHLKESDYEPNITVLDHGDGLVELCNSSDVDLIIIDYNLPHKDGAALISDIRGSGRFTEIVFYSQSLLKREDFGVMDGVFLCQRNEAVEKIQRVIDLTLHKLRDIGIVRGLIISEAIDLEVMIEELVVSEFEEKGSLLRERIVDKSYLDFETKLKVLRSAVEAQINTCESEYLKQGLKAVNTTLKKLSDEVGGPRNILAHSCPESVDGKTVLRSINKRIPQITFDSIWLASLRATLRKHRENLHSLEALLGSTPD